MAYVFRVNKKIIEDVLKKLKMKRVVSESACFQYESFTQLRKEVFIKDLDFQQVYKAFLRQRISSLDTAELQQFAFKQLILSGAVCEDAEFNSHSPDILRSKVYYRDYDFLYYLGETAGREIVDSILEMLKNRNIVSRDSTYDTDDFEKLNTKVKETFITPVNLIPPVTQRLFFMFSAVKKPTSIIELGTAAGCSLVWHLGPTGNNNVERAYGVEVKPDLYYTAIQNFDNIPNKYNVELFNEDAYHFIDKLNGTFDYVYLDVEDVKRGKGLYLDILKKLYNKLKPGAWVLAHDTTTPQFKDQLKDYLDFARNKNNFSESISFDIDIYGLELSIK